MSIHEVGIGFNSRGGGRTTYGGRSSHSWDIFNGSRHHILTPHIIVTIVECFSLNFGCSYERVRRYQVVVNTYQHRCPSVSYVGMIGTTKLQHPRCTLLECSSPAAVAQAAPPAVRQHRVCSPQRLHPFECRIAFSRARRDKPVLNPASVSVLCRPVRPSVVAVNTCTTSAKRSIVDIRLITPFPSCGRTPSLCTWK